MVATSNNYTTIVRTDYLADCCCQFFPQIERVHVCRGGRVEACIGGTFNFFIKLTGGGGTGAPHTPLLGGLYRKYVNFIKKLKVGIWAPVQAYRGVGYGGICAPIVNLAKKLKVGDPQK